MTLKRSLALSVQGRRSKLEYTRVFKATAKSINMTGRYAGRSIVAAKLVAKENSLEYKTLGGVKQSAIMEETSRGKREERE